MSNKYEAMCIVKADLAEEEKKALFNQVNDTVVKNSGSVTDGVVWSEKRKFCFPIKKQNDGVYYLLNFSLSEPQKISQIKEVYKLNENILRVLITRKDK